VLRNVRPPKVQESCAGRGAGRRCNRVRGDPSAGVTGVTRRRGLREMA